jgi:hypothetical protein
LALARRQLQAMAPVEQQDAVRAAPVLLRRQEAQRMRLAVVRLQVSVLRPRLGQAGLSARLAEPERLRRRLVLPFRQAVAQKTQAYPVKTSVPPARVSAQDVASAQVQ